jgi:hypothetical protein
MHTLSRPFALVVLMLTLAPVGPARAEAATHARNDYSDGRNWLCRPGRQDACAVDLSTTIVAADGTLTREEWRPNPSAPIDCFYVYPTVSTDPTPNSDMEAGPEERRVVRSQLARFGSACRLYAPIYRQISLAGLRAGVFGPIDGSDLLGTAAGTHERAIAYEDVADAWRSYLQHDNRGRGVVLIGHSQGAFLLAQLIQNEIDGKAVQSRLVSAILVGMSLPVARGKDEGGAFRHVPLCRATNQIGCVVTFASFRAAAPPPAETLFGRVAGQNMTSGCTNPAALAGGAGELHPYFDAPVGHPFTSSAARVAWTTTAKPIDTPFVSVPGLLTAACVADEHGSYLAVSVHRDPGDSRASDIPGDMKTEGRVNPAWGLHLVDMNLVLGNLVDLVGQQAIAFQRRRSH